MSDTDAVHAVRTAVAALNDGDIDGYLAGFSPACLRWVSGLDAPRTLDDMRSDINPRQSRVPSTSTYLQPRAAHQPLKANGNVNEDSPLLTKVADSGSGPAVDAYAGGDGRAHRRVMA